MRSWRHATAPISQLISAPALGSANSASSGNAKKRPVHLTLDVQHRGLGTGSCGPDTLDRYRLHSHTFALRLFIAPLAADSDAMAIARQLISGSSSALEPAHEPMISSSLIRPIPSGGTHEPVEKWRFPAASRLTMPAMLTNDIDFNQLNHADRDIRLATARDIGAAIQAGAISRETSDEVNCHVHTIYSFSPYSPSMAAWQAMQAKLLAVGIIDHDSVSGCAEMLDAGAAMGIAATAGFELRVDFSDTTVTGRKLNNPDSTKIAYIALHGVPRRAFADRTGVLQPLWAARNRRNRAMVAKLNDILADYDVAPLDFDRDVVAISRADEQGSITERHLLYALAGRLHDHCDGNAEAVLNFLRGPLGITVPEKLAGFITDPDNPHARYDLLGVLKSAFIGRIFIQPGADECLPVRDAVDFGLRIGAIPVYAYLGDVGESPTGDKKA